MYKNIEKFTPIPSRSFFYLGNGGLPSPRRPEEHHRQLPLPAQSPARGGEEELTAAGTARALPGGGGKGRSRKGGRTWELGSAPVARG
jgi:hypothetical protein